MLARYFGAAALALQCAHAFKDASPFFLFSTSQLDTQQLQNAQVASASGVQSNVAAALNDCSSHKYIFVEQAGVSAADFATQQSTQHLKRRLSGDDKQIKTAVKISNLIGGLDTEGLTNSLKENCNAEGKGVAWRTVSGTSGKIPHLDQKLERVRVTFSAPPVEKAERASTLARYDSYLNDFLQQFDSYTVVYTTTPVSTDYQEIQHPEQYEMDSPFPSGMHGDLKRDLSAHISAANTSNLYTNVPLFEKYQFVNQGIFVTGVVTLLLLSILSVGIRAIAGLEVSYMAFSKEMGPAAQKKQ